MRWHAIVRRFPLRRFQSRPASEVSEDARIAGWSRDVESMFWLPNAEALPTNQNRLRVLAAWGA